MSRSEELPVYGRSPLSVEALKAVFANFDWDGGNTAVVGKLRELIKKEISRGNWTVYGKTRYGCDDREFMVDFVLYEKTSSAADSGRIGLAVESELSNCGNDDVCWDFDKLLHLKAPLKMLIHKSNHCDSVKGRIEKYLADYSQHVQGEQYLFLLRNGKDSQFFKFESKGHRTVKNVKLEPL